MANKNTYDESRNELERSIDYGVSYDNINVRNVTFWIVLGLIIVIVMLFGVYNMYTYNQFLSQQQSAISSESHELKQIREEEHRKLNTLELIDEENMRYRIPIDSAITLIATDRYESP